MTIASRNDQHTLGIMLSEAEAKHANYTSVNEIRKDQKDESNKAIKQLINTREPCSGNTALHWAAKYGVI